VVEDGGASYRVGAEFPDERPVSIGGLPADVGDNWMVIDTWWLRFSVGLYLVSPAATDRGSPVSAR
jgi:hypothetical protein